LENSTFSPQNEEFILSIILKNCDKVDLSIINAGVFSSKQNILLFNAMKDLIDSGSVLDRLLVYNYLDSKNLLDKVGGLNYLDYLYQLETDCSNYITYVKILQASFKIRSFIGITKGVSVDSLNYDNIDYHLSSVRDMVEDLLLKGSTQSVLDFNTALKQSWQGLSNKINNGLVGIPFGITEIDTVIGGIMRGELWYIGARPSVGKTALMCNSAIRTSKSNNKILLLSLEMQRQAIIERILSIETGVSVFNLRVGNLKQKDIDSIHSKIVEIKDLPVYINTNFVPDLDYVETTIRKQHNQTGLDIVYLDYIQLLAERGDDSTHELGRISRRLKLLAGNLNIGIVVLSQLSREVEKRPNKRPIMSDLRQSGNLEEDADMIAFLYRDELYNKNTPTPNTMEFIIRKQRNGPIGTIPLKFEADTNRIGEI